jgi:exonuclease III
MFEFMLVDAKGQFTYWSQRVPANRPHNKGMRVDYFLCSADMFHLPQRKGDREEGGASAAAQCLSVNRRPPHPEVFDTYILPDAVAYSDHCPIMLVLKLEV